MANIIGIDLGTTFSALAMLNTIGKPEIIPNDDGDRITPSAIFFDEENPEMIRVGIEAINSRHLNVDRSARWIKRHMGEAGFKKRIDDKDWSPVELSSLILKKLKQQCAGEDSGCEAVISVPAHFDEARRKATMDAGSLAGLKVIGIVNEPVAAALYYATTKPINGKVLVYDLGGGTFDVTILEVKGHKIDIICSQGDHALGGIDFDRAVLEILKQQYKDKFGAELIGSEEEQAHYEDEAEDIKKTLSRRGTAKKMIYGPAGSMRVEITREMFEEAIAALLSRIDILLEVALQEAGLEADKIDRILLVGGSTRVPVVREKLSEMFGQEAESTVNVDECVALGAAIQAGLTLMREEPEALGAALTAGLKDINLTDVCNQSYGTICAPVDERTGKRVIQNKIILGKNTPLPCEACHTFYTVSEDQRELEVTITQGEDSDVRYVNKIVTHKFKLPAGRGADQPIKVTYSYDLNQRMHCKFEDVESGRVMEVQLGLDDHGQVVDVENKLEEMNSYQVS